ncbi:MAG: hypothetical protein IKD53_07205, partial [Clostridia bacterium]|nr:hypothetical protein [Clostridia bacterium]
MADRVILHADCNNFFASCECLERPELRTVPMAVAGDPENRVGVVVAKNELAKKFGIKTTDTVYAAKKKCPGIVCDGSLPCLVAIFASALAGLQTVLLDENASEELLRGQIMQTDIDMLWCSDDDLLGELESAL